MSDIAEPTPEELAIDDVPEGCEPPSEEEQLEFLRSAGGL